MSTERFSHFLDSLQSWSAEVPARAPAPVAATGHTNANQSARVRRVKGLLEAVGSDHAWTEGDAGRVKTQPQAGAPADGGQHADDNASESRNGRGEENDGENDEDEDDDDFN